MVEVLKMVILPNLNYIPNIGQYEMSSLPHNNHKSNVHAAHQKNQWNEQLFLLELLTESGKGTMIMDWEWAGAFRRHQGRGNSGGELSK